MAVEPGVPYYMSFYDLNPSKQRKCIFITKSTQRRCTWDCLTTDNDRAVKLHRQIIAASSGIVSLDLLEEYILCNCCRSGRAQHRDRIQYIDHLEPLAERWQQEILERVGVASLLLTAVEVVEENNVVADGASTLVVSTANDVTSLDMQSRSSSTALSDGEALHTNGSTMSETVATQSITRYASLGGKEYTYEPLTQRRYNLRPRDSNAFTNLDMMRTISRPKAPLPEFVPHINEPHLHENSVAYKLLNCLVNDEYDFRDGSLYIFDRSSSPGHVKIGWTSRTVQDRLDEWSECGYTPNLLFNVHNVPNAHRAETLTHHELIMEWRREGICKAAHCRKSHEEWFEISQEGAEKVVGEWAEFMKKARPYSSTGELKSEWRNAVQDMTDKGEVVTARKLLDRYEASVAQDADLTRRLDALEITINAGLGLPESVLKAEDAIETTVEQMGALRVEQLTSRQEELSLSNNTVPKKDPLLGLSLPETKGVKCGPQITVKSLRKREFTFTIQSSVTAGSMPTPEPTTQVGWLSQARLQPEPAPRVKMVSEAAGLPSSEFTFAFQSPVKVGPTEAERSIQPGRLFRAQIQPNSLALKDSAEKELTSEYIQRRPSPIEEVLQPEEIPLPPSPPFKPALLQLASDLVTSHYQNMTSEP
jgi:T5orf172 domain-containing protein